MVHSFPEVFLIAQEMEKYLKNEINEPFLFRFLFICIYLTSNKIVTPIVPFIFGMGKTVNAKHRS